ncbi:MAG: Apolipoprotein N-acyltransferase [Candidatus Celerinatantimonas neptuna]|nr:MAG: Apolipoprotein N-acyltransferase [Candidatus Celerinatantimonas neptuna]
MLKTLSIYLLALFVGSLSSFAFAPYHLWPLLVIGFIILLWILAKTDFPFRVGFCFALGFYAVGLRWVHVSIYKFGGLPISVSYIAVLLLAAYLALYPALSCWLAAKWPRKNLGFSLFWFPACWMISEWLRAHILTGFPWLMPGYSLTNTQLSDYASLFGVYGVSLILLWLSAALFELTRHPKRYKIPALSIIVILAGSFFLRHVQFTHPHQPLKIALIQGNEAIDTKWAPENRIPTLKRYWNLTQKQTDSDVIIWPESALPVIEYDAQGYLKMLDKYMLKRHQTLITGIIHQNQINGHYYNALVVLGQKTKTGTSSPLYRYNDSDRYYKRHLLPIGEFVPFAKWLRPLAKLFDLPMSSFSRGSDHQPDIRVRGHHWLSAICYEIAFGTELQHLITPDTDTILTISNDTWFGHSIGPEQHLQIAQMRAIEFQRPVVRGTNTGLTALINSRGQITALLPTYKTAVLHGTIVPATGETPYQRWGLGPIYLYLAIALLIFIRQRRQYGLVKSSGRR